MYTALRVASHVDYRLVYDFSLPLEIVSTAGESVSYGSVPWAIRP